MTSTMETSLRQLILKVCLNYPQNLKKSSRKCEETTEKKYF